MPKKKNSAFDSSIHVYRAMKRMTQQELANRVGVSRQTIIQLERNKYNPSLLLAHDIADVFGVTIEDIFTFKKLTDNENSTEQMNDSKEN
ncbi:helix-turn-helix transcriptional regulator [Melissococcus plutonius]|uniref:Transcriptional regulator, Cro/CI family n=2 Tax=Melissococcus plutonius TaxID=33970 RepID=F3YC29_MELPT|nr:helix-turn-helix transcriptional regulator [Melissococcus plutonius]BAL61698.1 Cro/CI family transcriptional regulator [Melissococcus plutonius DAT561]AIM25310.1 Cro/CI family transcriptional regulator [Melissococcus plutonius S1]KMT24002.1 Cro/CI family transcriptional regulator [Melissococcus plutonius]KMT24156.1 Cro/CI family transcriptional regulator [Melissococcus plutonius]KMT25501.1 Cro/CI family transcriptional regulator [Melissococcus plutonius]